MTTFRRCASNQRMLAAPTRPLPQPIDPSTTLWAFGTLMVTALSVVSDSLTWKPGLIPLALANFQNSARWKASMYCPVPIDVPPNFQGWLTKTGDFCVRVSALAPGSQLSTLAGFQVSPFENFMITGMSTALTVVDGLVTWIAGFLPTIV